MKMKTKMKKLGVLSLAALVAVSIAACGDKQSVQSSGLKLGIIESLTGPASAYGEAHNKGTRLAVEMINKQGGVNGKPIEVFAEDDKSDPATGINSAKKLLSQKNVDVIAGSPASLVTIAFSKENEKAKVPLVVGVAGSPTITNQNFSYVWRVNVTDNQLDVKMVDYFIKEKGMKRFAFFAENSDYGKPPTKAAAEEVKKLGGEVVAYEEYNRGETDFKAQLTNIRNAKADVLLVHGYYTEGSIIARQKLELGINSQFLVNMGQGVPKFAELAGAAASDGVVYPTNWISGLPGDNQLQFKKAFKEKYGTDASAFDAAAYSAIETIAKAAKLGGGNSAAEIQKGMGMLSGTETLLGPLAFDANRQNDGIVHLAKFKNGKIVPVND